MTQDEVLNLSERHLGESLYPDYEKFLMITTSKAKYEIDKAR